MQASALFSFYAAATIVCMFGSILLLLEIGRRIGIRRRALDPDGATAGLGAVEGAIFGLMGLLLAFTFSGAASRFDSRRHLIVEESNAIGTAYLRLDLLPAAAQPKLRDDFRQYLDARIRYYQIASDDKAAAAQMARAIALQQQIWTQAVASTKDSTSNAVPTLVLSSLNNMIDITATRSMARRTHPPTVVFVMLIVLVMASSVLAGYSMSAGRLRSRLHIVGFAIIMAVAVYVIFDIEFPRAGLVRVDSADQVLTELRDTMK